MNAATVANDTWTERGAILYFIVWGVSLFCAMTYTAINNPTINKFRTSIGPLELMKISMTAAFWFCTWVILLAGWVFFAICILLYYVWCIIVYLIGDYAIMQPLYRFHALISTPAPTTTNSSRLVSIPEGCELKVVPIEEPTKKYKGPK